MVRFDMNKKAATFLHKKYPEIVRVWNRPNGMTEIRIKDRRGKKTRRLEERKKSGSRSSSSSSTSSSRMGGSSSINKWGGEKQRRRGRKKQTRENENIIKKLGVWGNEGGKSAHVKNKILI